MLSDNHCRYDMAKHRYVLTPLYVIEVMNVNLDEILNTSGSVSDVANMPYILLDRVSKQIYDYIYRNSAYTNRKERELALEARYRPYLIEAMSEQLLYILNNGDISSYAGVNVINGMTIAPGRMRLAEIAPIARDVIEVRGLVSRRILPFMQDDEPSYEKDGY